MRLIGRILRTFLAIVGGFAVLLILVGVYVAATVGEEELPDKMVLTLDLDRGVTEVGSDNPLAQLAPGRPYALRDLVDVLDAAARDDRVTGLLAHVRGTRIGMARAQELRSAVLEFRRSGKPAVLFSESIGEFGAGTVEYFLASAFGQIWLQPSGDVSLTGFMIESPFVRGALQELGIEPQFAARHEYKTAAEILTEKELTPEGRSSLEGLLSAWYQQAGAAIAENRGLTVEKVDRLVDRAPLTAAEALEAKLVDRLGYRDEVEGYIKGAGAKFVDAAEFLRKAGRPHQSGTRIALIYGVGEVRSGEGRGSPLADGAVMAADTVAKAFDKAISDPTIRAILFRIDSPGGSYVASDTVWRQVTRAKAAGKPVVVSMGNIAASGGYFVGMAADRIIAQPGTVTGSIGVFSGKLVLNDFWGKLGINWDEVHRGANAPMWSMNQGFSESAWRRINALLDRIYQDFTAKAAQGRDIPAPRMDEVARGRIWSGSAAKEVGLVDDLGGLATALAHARELAGLASDAPVELVRLPAPKRPVELLLEMLGEDGFPLGIADRDVAALVDFVRPLARHVRSLGPTAGELRAPLVLD